MAGLPRISFAAWPPVEAIAMFTNGFAVRGYEGSRKVFTLKPAVEALVTAEVSTREQLASVATLTIWVKRGMGILPMNHGPVFAKATPWQAARATPRQLPFLGLPQIDRKIIRF